MNTWISNIWILKLIKWKKYSRRNQLWRLHSFTVPWVTHLNVTALSNVPQKKNLTSISKIIITRKPTYNVLSATFTLETWMPVQNIWAWYKRKKISLLNAIFVENHFMGNLMNTSKMNTCNPQLKAQIMSKRIATIVIKLLVQIMNSNSTWRKTIIVINPVITIRRIDVKMNFVDSIILKCCRDNIYAISVVIPGEPRGT